MSSATAQQNQPSRADQRQTYRITVTRRLQFAQRHKATRTGKAFLLDLSDVGCSLESKSRLTVGERLALVLELPQTVLITDAQVVWVDGSRYGLSFARVSPLERSRLRRFLWKHLPDAAMSDLLPLFAVVEEPHHSQTRQHILR
ncbi:MAG: PilZ domain-containing protein [Nitrospira sp.]|nr:PilZ domain-containing protein [Nitrospira sp.]